jgi:hypothetical protein
MDEQLFSTKVPHTVPHTDSILLIIPYGEPYGELFDLEPIRMENRMENFRQIPYGEPYGELDLSKHEKMSGPFFYGELPYGEPYGELPYREVYGNL